MPQALQPVAGALEPQLYLGGVDLEMEPEPPGGLAPPERLELHVLAGREQHGALGPVERVLVRVERQVSGLENREQAIGGSLSVGHGGVNPISFKFAQ